MAAFRLLRMPAMLAPVTMTAGLSKPWAMRPPSFLSAFVLIGSTRPFREAGIQLCQVNACLRQYLHGSIIALCHSAVPNNEGFGGADWMRRFYTII